MDIKVRTFKTSNCPIEGWKETDNCLDCKFFGGFFICQQQGRLELNFRCNHDIQWEYKNNKV